MSKLEDMIAELCPDGVEYKKLGEIATIRRGGSFQKKDFCDNGIPCIHYGQIYTRYGLFADRTLTFISEKTAEKQKYAVKNDIVMAVTSENIEDVCKCVAWFGEERIAVSGHTAIIHHTINPKYLCYYFHTAMFQTQKKKLAHGTKVIEVTPDKLSDIIIPVPPLEIQAEIVRILDEYTEKVTALQAELTAELEARKKQYEYYRDYLLDFGKNGGVWQGEWRTLGEVCSISAGGDVPKDSFSKTKTDLFNIPIISNGIGDNALYGYTNIEKIIEHAVTVAARGTIGYAEYRDYVYYPIIRLLTIIPNNTSYLNTKYLYYVLQNQQYDVPKTGIPQLTSPMVKKVSIPIPPLEEQQRIVSILDRFDKLCNDLTEGLPAEIEARKKQYEYYRDKLLTFKVKE